MTDLLAARIQLLFTPASTVVPLVRAGKLKALGVIGQRRLAALPEVPTITEAGVAGFESALWFGLNAPAGTSRATIDRLNREAVRALGMPEIRAQLLSQSIETAAGSPEQFGELIRADTAKWGRVVNAAGIKAD